jgi:hypothetical protein
MYKENISYFVILGGVNLKENRINSEINLAISMAGFFVLYI